MWRDAAVAVGADVRRLGPSLLEVRRGDAVTRIAHEQTTPFCDQVAFQLASDKASAHRVIAEAGVPVPEQAVVGAGEYALAEASLAGMTAPLIVKPARGSGGAGVVGHIRTRSQLRHALHDVWRYGSAAVLQRQIVAPTFRLLFLDGELLDVLRRPVPCVVGNGRSAVSTLVSLEARRRIAAGGVARGLPHLEIDLDCLFTLESIGYGPRSVPAMGEAVAVRSATNLCAPEETETVVGLLHDSTVEAARHAASAVGVRLAGVDVVTESPGSPLQDSGGAVLEVNPVPGLTQHYLVANRAERRDVAVPVLERLLELSLR
jgi:D-alanine-D-alanine ligase-like ATP-grasp enzyme